MKRKHQSIPVPQVQQVPPVPAVPVQVQQPQELIVINNCCADGYWWIKDYLIEHPNTKIKKYSMFQAHDNKLGEKYGFEYEELHKIVVIVEDKKIIKIPISRPMAVV